MRPIPRATPDQLKAIGMRERDQRPVECSSGDTIWSSQEQAITIREDDVENYHIGKYRWVLMPEVMITVEGRLATKQEALNFINGNTSKSVEKSICSDCTTPAILCPNANEPKDKVKECAIKNDKMPVEKIKKNYSTCAKYHAKCSSNPRFEACDCKSCNDYVQKPVAKKPAHTSCRGCFHFSHHAYSGKDSPCFGCGGDGAQFKNYTPAPAEKTSAHTSCENPQLRNPVEGLWKSMNTPAPAPAPKVTDAQTDKFSEVVQECFKLGMGTNGIQIDPEDVVAFIRDLAQRAGEERYAVEQVRTWLSALPLPHYALIHLECPHDGIAAVTERKGKGKQIICH
jgi:hypothetical protein